MVISEIDSQITLEYLQEQEENQYFERKGLGEKDIKPTKIADELIGMLNAGGGGVLAFGVSDIGEIQDLKTLGNKLESYRKLAFEFIVPYNMVELEEVDIEGKMVFLYHVSQDVERIYKRSDNENIYLRIGDTNRLLDREKVKALEYDKFIVKFEDEINPEFDFEDLDLPLLEKYKSKLNYTGDVLELLNKRYLAVRKDGVYKIKNAGILLFSKAPEKYISSASLRYIRYDGCDAKVGSEHNVVKDVRFEQNIPGIIVKVKEFLRATIKDFHFLDIEKGVFRKVAEYPEEAWLEGVVNALCHRSYNVQGSSIYIKHFDDRIEISNSGPLPAQVSIENIREERFSRNPKIARVLEDMEFVRQLNEGVKRIYQSMEKSMLSVPEYKEVHKNVYLTLRNKVSSHSKTISDSILSKVQDQWKTLNLTQKKILHFLFFNNEATVETLAGYTEVNERTVRRNLTHFVKEGILERLSEKQRDIHALYVFKRQ